MIVWITLILMAVSVSGSQQYFRLRPKDQKVQEGGEVKLECEISSLHGQVQWTKDGFALGFDSIIPGHPRYSYVGDRKAGVYNLLIKNISLEDDAEFQCQAGPSAHQTPIRANAHLTVVSPPAAIEIVNPPISDSKIQINENQEIEIECLVKNSKPAAQVVWYKGHTQLKTGNITESVMEVKDKRITRYTVSSKLKLKPTADDDYAEYSCQARHEALPADMPMHAKIQLSVLYPPGQPYIEGYVKGETVRRGQTVELACRSRGGNPPAQLIWYKNGDQIRMAYRTAARLSENVYTFTADASDNKAKYRCEASNIMSPSPLKAEVTLTVLFAPAHVTISGATEAKVGDKVALTCTADNSNPPAEIKWLVTGKQLRNTTSMTTPSPHGGSVTSSNITVHIGQNRRSVVVVCHGINMQLTENVLSTHTINVLYPPGQPLISGYEGETAIPAGTVQRISCISSGGNPLASLTWYKNDKKISSVSKIIDRSVSAEITILTNVTDNGAVYKCEASNPATEVPLIEAIKLNVLFAPDHVEVRKEPKELKPGDVATLTCEASSSHPAARLSWWREGIPLPSAPGSEIVNMSRPGLHGGVVSSLQLKLNVTPDIAGTVFTCQATNDALQRSVHDAFTLNVLYKPIFETNNEETVTGIEGESLVVTLSARGNPSNIVYTWNKDGLPLTKKSLRILADGPSLNFTRVTRNDSGIYSCEASNAEGRTTTHVNVSIKYGAEITDAPTAITVDSDEDATLYCRIDGLPLDESHVTWRSDVVRDLDAARTTRTFRNNTAFLLVHSVSREDSGPYECIADNGVGNKSVRLVHLLVKFKPEMDTSPTRLKAASNTGDTGRLTCRTTSVPRPRFRWSREGVAIPTNTSTKFSVEFRDVDLSTFETILIVNEVDSSDYGRYECEARNEKGFATTSITLHVTSAPDPPLSLSLLNTTHDAVTLVWVPGFDGGLSSNYRIRYKPIISNLLATEGYRYLDVVSENATTFTITGLELDTEYQFSIMAFNKLGNSKYLTDHVKVRTSNGGPPSLQSPSLGSMGQSRVSAVVIVVVAASGTALLALNIILVGCCLRRRSRNKSARFPELILPDELLGKADVPRIVIISVSVAGAILLLFNILLVVFFILKKRGTITGKKKAGPSEQGSNKSATIEMYAPSSYNETVTGETLSSVSEKSENYSNAENNDDYMDESRKAASTYLIDQIDYPFQYVPAFEMQQQLQGNHLIMGESDRNTLPHPVLKSANYAANAMLPMPPQSLDGSYYTLQPDSRYLAYATLPAPPTLDYSHTLPGQGSLRRGRARQTGVPPDVTMLHNHNPPVLSATLMPQQQQQLLQSVHPGSMSTFGPASAAAAANAASLLPPPPSYSTNLESEGHLV